MVSTINEWIVRDYAGLVNDCEGVVLLGIESLTVEESQALRNSVREAGAELRVTKKRLAQVALSAAGIEIEGDESWSGTVGLLVGDTESTISAAKAIDKTWKKADPKKITWRAAYLDGSMMSAAEAALISDMPDKQTLRGMLCGTILAPARHIASLLSEVPASTARVLQARADEGGAE